MKLSSVRMIFFKPIIRVRGVIMYYITKFELDQIIYNIDW